MKDYFKITNQRKEWVLSFHHLDNEELKRQGMTLLNTQARKEVRPRWFLQNLSSHFVVEIMALF